MLRLQAILLLLLLPPTCSAGLHCSAERFADLPSEWKGFLGDLRQLRGVAVNTPGAPPSTLKLQRQQAARELLEKAKTQELTADEAADLGAHLIRLGKSEQALGVLRESQRKHPDHFALAANLGTAWQLQGDLRQAAAQLRQAVKLAPEAKRPAEALHLRWVLKRLAEPAGTEPLDDLFGLAAKTPLPPNALALTQQLVLWFPGEGRLLWLLGELAERYGDARGAAELLEVAVGEFGLAAPEARRRRAAFRAAWVDQLKQPLVGAGAQKTAHLDHGASPISFKSKRPLVLERFDYRSLGAARKDGPNPVPWGLLLETALDQRHRPTFPKPLKELAGLKVELVGYMQPLGDDVETSLFLLVEQPVGCWFCELPETTGIICVELKAGKSLELTRNPLKIVGTLKLNSDDPEDFFFTVTDAEVGVPD